jgi:hypothetical protein
MTRSCADAGFSRWLIWEMVGNGERGKELAQDTFAPSGGLAA